MSEADREVPSPTREPPSPPAFPDRTSSFLERLRRDEPLVAAELRPPRTDLSYSESIDSWIDLHHALRGLSRRDSAVFLTDNAVGAREEENLRHLTTNVAGRLELARAVPFLTCKHSLEACLLYADRAASHGIDALTVVGGDRSVGPARCVEHAYMLRKKIRRRAPSLTLGGWANPHRDPERQVGYLLQDDFAAEYYLTQVVSHHDIGVADSFLREARRRGVPHPAVFGVFYYRSANSQTLETLSRFFPVPTAEVTREFEAGASPAEVCARSIRALHEIGADKVYISNLGFRRAESRYRGVMKALADPEDR